MRAAAGEATATYGQFIVINTVALSLGNLTTLLTFQPDVHRDTELKVSHELVIGLLSYNKDKGINKNNVGEENNNKRYV